MKTGFYDLSKLSQEQLLALFTKVRDQSHFIACESKYTEGNKWRGPSRKYTIQDFLDMVDKENHNVFIDRSVQGAGIPDTEVGEVGFILASKFDKDWHQITYRLSLANLKALAEEFKLEMQ